MEIDELKTLKRRVLWIWDILIYASFIWLGWQLHTAFQ